MWTIIRSSVVAIGLLSGCDGSSTPAFSETPCTGATARCAGSDLVECRSGTAVPVSCAARCATLFGRASTGCRALIDAAAECECAVVPACTGPSSCQSSDVESLCRGGVSRERSCYAHCADAGVGLVPTGCFSDPEGKRGSCACATEGTLCSPDHTGPCAGPQSLTTCTGGAWHVVDCAATCQGRATCDHDSKTDQGRCICQPG